MNRSPASGGQIKSPSPTGGRGVGEMGFGSEPLSHWWERGWGEGLWILIWRFDGEPRKPEQQQQPLSPGLSPASGGEEQINSPSLPASPPQAGERSRSTAPLSRPLPRKRGRGADQQPLSPGLSPASGGEARSRALPGRISTPCLIKRNFADAVPNAHLLTKRAERIEHAVGERIAGGQFADYFLCSLAQCV